MNASKAPFVESTESVKRKVTPKVQPSVDSVINWQLPLLLILFVSCVFVAVQTVVHRHESRTAYMKLQKLEKERDKLAAQWSRLKLEQATALNQVKVERYARGDLRMQMPKASEVKIIQETRKVRIAANNSVPLDSGIAGLAVVASENLVSQNPVSEN